MPVETTRLRERLIQLTRDLVLIESTDDQPEERQRCFQLIRNHLDEVPGLELQMLECGGYESLVALPRGVSKPDVLLCGHLDVVQHIDSESYRSEIRDGRIYGPGTGDMKGQLAIMIQLIRHLEREKPGISVGLVISSDEERGGECGVRFLVEEMGLSCGVALIPDGGSITEITVEEKGILHLRLVAEGNPAHAARPWLGVNAIDRLLESLTAIQERFHSPEVVAASANGSREQWISTTTVTMISTPNDSPNRIPGSASAVLDIRFVPPATLESTVEQVRECLVEGVTPEVIVGAEPTHLAPDVEFLRIAGEVSGEEPKLVRVSGGSDGRFFSARGIPVIISRPNVGNLHGRDEWIDIDSMMTYFEICRRYCLNRCGLIAEAGTEKKA